jgi:glycolate oxidase iron-sulfur subunit
VTREEAESPRGRILLVDALRAGQAAPANVRPHLDLCIGCLACESVCPSGVPYREILEEGRRLAGGPRRHVRFFLERLLPRRRLMGLLTWPWRRGKPLPLPAAPPHPKGRIALHLGCLTHHLFPRLAGEAAHLLTRLNWRVEIPAEQGCCGALHRHAGLPHEPPRHEGFDFVLSPAAGCSTTPGLTDLSAFLLRERAFEGARLPPTRVAWHPPCHLLHAQRIDASPLLRGIEGIDLVPLSDACCGAGGLYMELQPRMAREVRRGKLDEIRASGASVVATANPGCMLWLMRGGFGGRVEHPVSLLYRALRYE